MAAARKSRPLRILVRNLLLCAVLAGALYALFLEFNEHFFASKGFTHPAFLALEAGAILLVAYLVAQSATSAANAVLERRGIASRGHAVRLFLNLLIAAVAEVAVRLPGTSPGFPPPHLEVTDISEKTWDGVVVVWSTGVDEGAVRDQILRSVLASLPSARPAR